MTNFKLVKAECAKTIIFEGRYKDCKVYILAKEAVSSKNRPVVQFYLGCELYQDFKAVYEIPEGTEINTEKGFFEVAHQILYDNIEAIVEKNFEDDIDYRTIYKNDNIDNNEDDKAFFDEENIDDTDFLAYLDEQDAELDRLIAEYSDEDIEDQFCV